VCLNTIVAWHPVEISIDDTLFDMTTEVYASASSAATREALKRLGEPIADSRCCS
jgi:hypothetical protein